MSNGLIYPTYNTKTFTEIYPKLADFTSDYSTINLGGITDTNLLNKVYYMLYAKHGNDPITNFDIEQFKYKLFTIICSFGPSFEKRLEIQGKLRALDLDTDVLEGAKAIYNHAYNPSTDPSTQSLNELTYINDQNTTNYKKSKMDAWTQVWGLLSTDLYGDFISRFDKLFKQFVRPNLQLVYEGEDTNE